MRLVRVLDRCGRFLDALANAQISERSPCLGRRAMQDILNLTYAFRVQALLSLHRTKIHKRVTEKFLLFRRHQPSIQCRRIALWALIIFDVRALLVSRDDATSSSVDVLSSGKNPKKYICGTIYAW